MFGSHGRYRIEELEKGDAGCIPQGYGHSIENVGNTRCRVLIGFNTGVYAAIDLSQWIAGKPEDIANAIALLVRDDDAWAFPNPATVR